MHLVPKLGSGLSELRIRELRNLENTDASIHFLFTLPRNAVKQNTVALGIPISLTEPFQAGTLVVLGSDQ